MPFIFMSTEKSSGDHDSLWGPGALESRTSGKYSDALGQLLSGSHLFFFYIFIMKYVYIYIYITYEYYDNNEKFKIS